MKISAFVYLNGLNPEIFYEWCEELKLLRDDSAWRHVKYLFDKFENTNFYHDRIYSFHVGFEKWMFLNGNTAYY